MTDSTDLPPLPHLSPPAQSLLDDILGTKVLGASRNIRQINDLFCLAVEDRASASADELRATLRQLGDYFIATRGKNTPAIGNAILAATGQRLRHLPFTPERVLDALEGAA